MSKRVLLIAYNFPPLVSPQSIRWFYLSRELSRRGYEVDILTVKMPRNFRDLEDAIPSGITVHRTFPGPFYYFTFRHSREAGEKGFPRSGHRPSAAGRLVFSVYSAALSMLNALPVPDAYTEWLPFALSKGSRLLKSGKYDLIISSSEPRICHVVGHLLKKNSGLPWIADYGDPWVYPMPIVNESSVKRGVLNRLEGRLIPRMDAITVAAEGIRKLYLERYPGLDEGKISVIPQGFDPEMFSAVVTESPRRFRIVYAGSLYRKLRDPSAFFEAVKEIGNEKPEVVIAGRIGEFADAIRDGGLSRIIDYRGFLGHRESLSLEKSASVLLHIGNATDIQVPGKIYEYLGAGKPILCVRGGDKDVSADLVLRYNRGIVVDNRKDEIREGILELCRLWKEGLFEKRFDQTPVEEFTWCRAAGTLAGAIEKL